MNSSNPKGLKHRTERVCARKVSNLSRAMALLRLKKPKSFSLGFNSNTDIHESNIKISPKNSILQFFLIKKIL
jgi:hypothetical protein